MVEIRIANPMGDVVGGLAAIAGGFMTGYQQGQDRKQEREKRQLEIDQAKAYQRAAQQFVEAETGADKNGDGVVDVTEATNLFADPKVRQAFAAMDPVEARNRMTAYGTLIGMQSQMEAAQKLPDTVASAVSAGLITEKQAAMLEEMGESDPEMVHGFLMNSLTEQRGIAAKKAKLHEHLSTAVALAEQHPNNEAIQSALTRLQVEANSENPDLKAIADWYRTYAYQVDPNRRQGYGAGVGGYGTDFTIPGQGEDQRVLPPGFEMLDPESLQRMGAGLTRPSTPTEMNEAARRQRQAATNLPLGINTGGL